jgi:uncharacterized protein YkwD
MARTRLVFLFMLSFVFVCLLTAYTGLQAPTSSEAYPRDEAAELEVITELNFWRIRRGLSPLQRNPDLDYLAMLQAEYIAPNVPFTGEVDFHTDQYGDGVFKRAELAGWPGYDTPDRVLVSEIAAYFPSVDGAINFWQHSAVHKASVETGGFRELGVAVLRYENWYISYVVLGGRPEVYPVLYDPTRGTLYLSIDRSVFSDNYRPTRVQILDAAGNRLHNDEWLIWSDRMPLPQGASDVLTVIYSDGIREYKTSVNLYDARIFPSMPTPTPSNTPTPAPTATPVLATSTPQPPTMTPTSTQPPANGHFEVKLVYDNQSLTLINESSSALNLVPLTFVSQSIGLTRTGAWLGKYSKVSLETFPSHYCMQAWSFEQSHIPPTLPEDCTVRASGRSVLKVGERFWLAGRFEVAYRNETIAVCYADTGQCAFDIPDN